MGQAGGPGRAAECVWRAACGGERRRRRDARRAGARARSRGRHVRVRVGRYGRRHGHGDQRQPVPRRARGCGRDRLYADHGGQGHRSGGRPPRQLEAAGSAAGVVRAARRAGMRGPVTARKVFQAAAAGDERAAAVVADEVGLVARAVCAIVTVIDPELIVLGGGSAGARLRGGGRRRSRTLAPVMPDVRVSALGTQAVVDGPPRRRARLATAIALLRRGPTTVPRAPPVLAGHEGAFAQGDATLSLPPPVPALGDRRGVRTRWRQRGERAAQPHRLAARPAVARQPARAARRLASRRISGSTSYCSSWASRRR